MLNRKTLFRFVVWIAWLGFVTTLSAKLKLLKTISGNITPKSVGYDGQRYFFAQNMMYSHTVTVYDRSYRLVKTIPDAVNPSHFGYPVDTKLRGAPVEVTFSPDSRYAYVSQYGMFGRGYKNTAGDFCKPGQKWDNSFVYRIRIADFKIDRIYETPPVPKFLKMSPDGKYVLISNFCSGNVSVLSTKKHKIIKAVKTGWFPRGIDFTSDSKLAIVASMDGHLSAIEMKKLQRKWLWRFLGGPRHVLMGKRDRFFYVSLNLRQKVVKVDLKKKKIVGEAKTGHAPRSMVFDSAKKNIFVGNYKSGTMSKIRVKDMKVLFTQPVCGSPIGITYDPKKNRVWVACYGGQIKVYQDRI